MAAVPGDRGSAMIRLPASKGQRRPGVSVNARSTEGPLLAGRYQLLESVGFGATAEVFRARHAATGAEVAVKLFRSARALEPARLRREIAVLRMLRLPGIVELVDEGSHRGRPFLVTTFVRGSPFPGARQPVPWQSIALPTSAVLETLSRVHAAGIVHRDIKPANVLVDERGGVTLLDFGIAWANRLAEGLTGGERFLGTPAYVAPEQIRGLPPDARTDLYSFGIMLFEALTGRLPQSADDQVSVLAARAIAPAPGLRSVTPGVPARVAAVIDRMLAIDPEARPQSATEVLAALIDTPPVSSPSGSPWLGSLDAVHALVSAGEAGRSLCLLGGRGYGKTRNLEEACEILEARGRRIVKLAAATYPFEALEPLVGNVLTGLKSLSLEEATEQFVLWVQAALRSGVIVAVDERRRLDIWTRRVLDRCAAAGAILQTDAPDGATQAEIVELSPLPEEALRPLFAGQDRIFHVREDGARLLLERTEGVPRNIELELLTWRRQGFIHAHGGRWALSRAAIEHLGEASHADLLLSGVSSPRERPPQAWQDLLAFVGFLTPDGTPEALIRVTGWPRFRVEAGLDELTRLGFVRSSGRGRHEPRWSRFSLPEWSAERSAEAHRRAAEALSLGAPRRLFHLVAAAVESGPSAGVEILDETCARAGRLAGEGRVGAAFAVLSDGIGAALKLGGPRQHEGGRIFAGAFELWAELAVAEQAIPEADRLLCELLRIRRRGAALKAVEALVVAAAAFRRGALDSLSLAESVPYFKDARLERQRQAVRVLAARRHDLATEERVVGEAAAWADRVGDPEARAAALAFQGRLRYRQGRFAEAGRLHEAAASLERLPTLRIAARLNAASALLEAFCHADAERLAELARAEAAACRSPFFEARAEWVGRTARFRAGTEMLPDEELVEATASLNVPDQLAVTCLSEAAIAWHARLFEVAARLAARTRRTWEMLGLRAGAQFAECIEIASGVASSDEDVLSLARALEASPVPGVAVQALGLLSVRLPKHPWLLAAVQGAWERTEPALRPLRGDVLSADEALLLAEAGCQQTASTAQPW